MPANLVEPGIRFARKRGEAVERREIGAGWKRPAGHRSPDVPRKHFHVVQRREVSDQVLRDLDRAAHIEDAEGLRIGFAIAAPRPGLACCEKLVARNVEQIKWGLEYILLDGVDLRVDQNPLLAPTVPIFADLMVLVAAGLNVVMEGMEEHYA